MFNKLLQLYTDIKIRLSLKRDFNPTRDEKTSARAAFMSEVERQFPFHVPETKVHWGRYAAIAAVILFVFNGGALIYADTEDVGIDHPLYSFKRVAEEVRGFTATPSQKAKFETELAERRLKEIDYIEKKSIHEEKIEAVIASTTVATSTKRHDVPKVQKIKEQEVKKLKEDLKARIKVLEETKDIQPDIKIRIEKIKKDTEKIDQALRLEKPEQKNTNRGRRQD